MQRSHDKLLVTRSNQLRWEQRSSIIHCSATGRGVSRVGDRRYEVLLQFHARGGDILSPFFSANFRFYDPPVISSELALVGGKHVVNQLMRTGKRVWWYSYFSSTHWFVSTGKLLRTLDRWVLMCFETPFEHIPIRKVFAQMPHQKTKLIVWYSNVHVDP